MKDENCIFCRLASGEIPANTIYEDDRYRVILDANPATRGHALILPKEHFADIYEIDEETAAGAMRLAKRMAAHMTDVLKCDGFNILQNNREAAGQTVFHFHMHLVPRYEDERNERILTWDHAELSEGEIAEICEKLKC